MAISLGLTGTPASRLSSTAQVAGPATAVGVCLGAGFELLLFARRTPRRRARGVGGVGASATWRAEGASGRGPKRTDGT
jgi:hypothetical protein